MDLLLSDTDDSSDMDLSDPDEPAQETTNLTTTSATSNDPENMIEESLLEVSSDLSVVQQLTTNQPREDRITLHKVLTQCHLHLQKATKSILKKWCAYSIVFYMTLLYTYIFGDTVYTYTNSWFTFFICDPTHIMYIYL